MSHVTEEMLMAYTDGELNELDRRRIEKAAANSPALKERLDAHKALKEEIEKAVQDAADAPMSDGLAAALEATKGVHLMHANSQSTSATRSFWQIPSQIAAAVAVVALGLWMAAPAPEECCEAEVYASNEMGLSTKLAGYLSSVEDNSQMAGVLIEESYVADGTNIGTETDKGFCRAFRITKEPDQSRGLACRKAGQAWQLVALVPEGAYMPAGLGQDHPIDALLMRMQQLELGGEHAHLRE